MARSVFSAALIVVACTRAATAVSPPLSPRPAETPLPARPMLFEHADATCGSCASHVTGEGGPCAQELSKCRSDPDCVRWLRCTEKCDAPGDACMQKCAETTAYEPMVAGNAYMFCTCCRSDCLDSCRATCSKYRSGLTGPVGAGCTLPAFDAAPYACNRCLDDLFFGSKSKPDDAYHACLAQSMDTLDCIDGCSDASCMLACRRTAVGEALACGTRYLSEACCGPCASACARDCKDRGVKCP